MSTLNEKAFTKADFISEQARASYATAIYCTDPYHAFSIASQAIEQN